MKLTLNFEWRKKDEPTAHPERLIPDVLREHGYTVVDSVFVQGAWDEDKPKFPGGKWDENRLPHEEIAK